MSISSTGSVAVPAVGVSATVAVTSTSGSGLALNGFVRLNDGASEIVGLITALSTNSITFTHLVQNFGSSTINSGAIVAVGANPQVPATPVVGFVQRGTALLVPVDGSAPAAVALPLTFPNAVDNIQLTVRSHTSATLKNIAVYPIGAAITTSGFDIEGFGGDAASTASVDWEVKGH